MINAPNEIYEKEITEKIIGKNSTYYLKKWNNSTSPERKSGWNWAAFFLSFFWLGYRKMYKYLIISISIYFVACIILGSVGSNAAWGISAGLGLQGNAYYYTHIKKLQEKHRANPASYPVNKIGGTSWAGVFITTGLILLGVFIIGSIFG